MCHGFQTLFLSAPHHDPMRHTEHYGHQRPRDPTPSSQDGGCDQITQAPTSPPPGLSFVPGSEGTVPTTRRLQPPLNSSCQVQRTREALQTSPASKCAPAAGETVFYSQSWSVAEEIT